MFALRSALIALRWITMPQRLAAILASLAFAVCLYVGAFEAGNPFTTTVERALAAMGVTYVVGLVVGTMGRRAIEENLAAPAVVPTPAAEAVTPAVTPGAVSKSAANPPAKPAVKAKATGGR